LDLILGLESLVMQIFLSEFIPEALIRIEFRTE
jgi:hypothetical protein